MAAEEKSETNDGVGGAVDGGGAGNGVRSPLPSSMSWAWS